MADVDALIALLVLAFLCGPVLAIIALLRTRGSTGPVDPALLQSLVSRIYALEQRLAGFEKELSAGIPSAPSPMPPEAAKPAAPLPVVKQLEVSLQPEPPPVPAPPKSSVPTESQLRPGTPPPPIFQFPQAKKSTPLDLETLIAGRWFNRIGIVALLFAVSYFLKLAFDNNWIGPSGRVAIGILLGALMLPWSQWLLGRGYAYFSEGIAALGEATLYVSVWAGCQYYSLYSRDVGFISMIVITAVMAAFALGRNSQRIAVLSLLGGFLTPILVSTGKDQQIVLFTYLIILGAGMLVIGVWRKWSTLAPLSFVLTQLYFWGWYSDFYYRSRPLERTVVFATLFFLLYAAVPVIRAVRFAELGGISVFLLLANSFAYLGALYALLWPDYRWPLTLFALALSAAHLAVAHLLPVPESGRPSPARLMIAGLALMFATLAIPIRLEGKWITLAFAVEGAILVWTGFRSAAYYLRQAGYILLAIAAVRLLFFPPPGGAFLWNQRFGSFVAFLFCAGIVLWSARERIASLNDTERGELAVLAVAVNVYALIALSTELWDFFGRTGTVLQADLAQHLSLSVLWTIYASVLILVGVQRRSALLRWQALILFGLVVVKVFLYDLSFLERAYRILSFLILGVVLLVVSFLYQRRSAREQSGS